MKKLLSSICLGLMTLGALAQTTYVVYTDTPLAANQEVISNNYYIWEGTYSQTGTWEQTPITITFGNAGWAGGGWESVPEFDYSRIAGADYDMVITLRSAAQFRFSLQFNNTTKGVASGDTPFSFTHDGNWQEIRVNLKKNFPAVVASIAAGDKVYTPGMVFNDITPGQTVDIRSIRFEPAKHTTAEAGKTFYGHKDLSVDNSISGPVSVGLDYKFVTNADGTVTISWNYTNLDPVIGHVEDEIQLGDTFPIGVKTEGAEYAYSYTTPKTYEAGETLKVTFRLKQAGPLVETPVEYIVGAENEKPAAAPAMTATVGDITTDGATISYNVTLPEALKDASVKVLANGVEVANPYVITGLTENSEYTYTLVAVATLAGKEYKSEPASVTFRTLRADAKDKVFKGTATGTFDNAMVGDNVFEAVDYTMNYSITYTTLGNLKIDMTLETSKNVIGMVPQLMINGPHVGNFTPATRATTEWTYTTPGTYNEGEELTINLFCAYAGGAKDNVFKYTVGSDISSAVEGIEAENDTVDIYTLSGILIRGNVEASSALNELPAGLYIVGGKKVIVR